MGKNNCDNACRLGKVGGQAVIEGVMMKAGERTVTTCRKENGTLVVVDGTFKSVRQKYKILDLPLVRGVVNFVEMMILSVKTLGISADALDLDVDENGKKNENSKLLGVLMAVATVLGVVLSIGLFMFLPNFLTSLFSEYVADLGAWEAVVEGFIKIAIFISYLLLISLMKDIKRTFMYHGAEHKSIACFEAGGELTPERAREYRRFHPRCGTSFMFFMILIGIAAGLFIKILIPGLPTLAYTAIRIGLLPLVMGIGYEIIRLAGRHDNVLTRFLSAPGLWVQRITTKEPTDDMLEVAIISLKCALRDDFPEFKEFYESKAWEPESDEASNFEESASTSECENAENENSIPTSECGSVGNENSIPTCDADEVKTERSNSTSRENYSDSEEASPTFEEKPEASENE